MVEDRVSSHQMGMSSHWLSDKTKDWPTWTCTHHLTMIGTHILMWSSHSSDVEWNPSIMDGEVDAEALTGGDSAEPFENVHPGDFEENLELCLQRGVLMKFWMMMMM